MLAEAAHQNAAATRLRKWKFGQGCDGWELHCAAAQKPSPLPQARQLSFYKRPMLIVHLKAQRAININPHESNGSMAHPHTSNARAHPHSTISSTKLAPPARARFITGFGNATCIRTLAKQAKSKPAQQANSPHNRDFVVAP
ncbi:hypothetical protein Emed_007584 [Eimeria media]